MRRCTSYENGSVTKSTIKQQNNTYESANLQLIKSLAMRNNSTEQSVKVTRYPFQLSANSSSTGAAQSIYTLNNKHVRSIPIETYTYLQNIDTSSQRIVSGQVTTFRQNASNPAYVVPDQIFLWESAATIPKASYVPLTINAGNTGLSMDPNMKARVNIPSYDDLGNVHGVAKTNDVLTSYMYGYNRALPIAEVRNAQNTLYNANGIVPINMSAPGTTLTQNFPITVDYLGTVTLKLGVATNPPFSTSATYSGITSGTISILPTGACGYASVVFNNVAPGNYTISITLNTTNAGSAACGEIDYPKSNLGVTEFLYESFEENASGTTNVTLAHSASKYYIGHYTVTFTMPNSRNYLIEYWYLDNNNVWQYITKAYVGTSMLLSEGNAIDDVRIYPMDAQMKSYTYDPILGIRSIIDETSRIHTYEYDTFGRLMRIKNDHGNIEKQYSYNYKGN